MSKIIKSQEFELQYQRAWKIRCIELKLLELIDCGLISGTIHTCIGQEINSILLSPNLNEEDIIFSNHRGHGHFLSRYPQDEEAFLSEILSVEGALNNGISGTQHIHHKNISSPGIIVPFLGEGSFGQGLIFEAFNFAAIPSLPIL